ncbi:MAG TPA: hemin uptake protein HemP [Macromonas sp.]|nr:hemin uptake protein HemP [Macromonas sp.]
MNSLPPSSGVDGSSPAGPQPAPASPGPTRQAIDSQLLLRGQKEALIAHNGVTYRLQATRQGKLILTK